MAEGLQTLPHGPAAALESIIQKCVFNNVKVSVEGAVPKGQNYTGEITRVTVTGEKDGQDVTKSYIVKVALNNESIRSDIPLSIAYQREAMYYTELFPIYQRMQVEAGIPYEDQFRFAECYQANKEYLNEFLIFEDLKSHGYATLGKELEMDYEHARCALAAYGKLHALSFALKKREPEKFKYFTRNTTEAIIEKDNMLTNIYKSFCEKATPIVKNIKHREVFGKLKDTIVDGILDIIKQDEFSVLSHSDCWSANMMFKYKNEKPVETCLIDFQVCRYGAPTIDIMQYIFSNTGKKLREQHYEDLLSVYHNAMKDHLKAFSYDVDQIYPWARFEKDLKKSSLLGLVMGLGVALIILSDEIPDACDFANFENSPMFKNEMPDVLIERVNDIVEDFFKYGYLS